MVEGVCTVVVDEVGDSDAKQRRVQTRVQSCDALTLDNSACSAQSRRLGALRLDLSARGEGDERVGQGHRQQTSTSTGERMRNIVALLRCRALGHSLRRLGELLLGFLLDLRHGVDRFELRRAGQ